MDTQIRTSNDIQNVFIVGAKGLGSYGGYETFVDKLTEYHQNEKNLQYHIACKANGEGRMDISKLNDVKKLSDSEFIYHNARCFMVRVPDIGAAQAIYYDLASLEECCRYIKKHQIPHPIVYILACRVGPFINHYHKKIHRLGGRLFINPDGHEWMRSKWSKPVRAYWKCSEKLMVKHSDLVICDSKNIEKYIHESYDTQNRKTNTTFIAYGAEVRKSKLSDDDEKIVDWNSKHKVVPNEYYLIVGRFVPENNYETMIREFMMSDTKRDLVIVTNPNNKFYDYLKEKTDFDKDPRIKFVGTVYDQELLMKIRENAYAYIHGHEVGGTNPSLLEALGSTKLNLLLDVGFNREVAEEAAVYWTKKNGDLYSLLKKIDSFSAVEIKILESKAQNRIEKRYSWKYICQCYKNLF